MGPSGKSPTESTENSAKNGNKRETSSDTHDRYDTIHTHANAHASTSMFCPTTRSGAKKGGVERTCLLLILPSSTTPGLISTPALVQAGVWGCHWSQSGRGTSRGPSSCWPPGASTTVRAPCGGTRSCRVLVPTAESLVDRHARPPPPLLLGPPPTSSHLAAAYFDDEPELRARIHPPLAPRRLPTGVASGSSASNHSKNLRIVLQTCSYKFHRSCAV